MKKDGADCPRIFKGLQNTVAPKERRRDMNLREIRDILDAAVFCGENSLDREVKSACASDFMSDVLAFVKNQGLLLTGMVNPQVVRTAEMMDMCCIVFVRGKQPDEVILQMARERDIVVMGCKQRLFIACGLLYSKGLAGE
jgi:predicted transcriptional regulator